MQAAPYSFALAWQKKPDFAGPKTGPKNWPQFRGRDIILNKKGGQFLGADSGPETQKKTKPNEQKKGTEMRFLSTVRHAHVTCLLPLACVPTCASMLSCLLPLTLVPSHVMLQPNGHTIAALLHRLLTKVLV